MSPKRRDIKYINKDFNSFKEALINFTKTYFPDTYNDFNPESLGMMFIEMSSYVGDVLSFYIDNQIQEIFPQNSRLLPNLYKHAYNRGYKPKISSPSIVDLEFYQEVDALGNNPDFGQAEYLPENTVISSSLNPSIKFIIQDPVDFNFSSSYDPTEIEVLEETVGGDPIKFLLKKTRKAISASIKEEEFTLGGFEKFRTLDLNDNNIIGILEVKDSDNNKWYEVPNLASDVVYEYENNTTDSNVYYNLEVKRTQYRFVSRFIDDNTLRLEFGSGNINDYDSDLIPLDSNLNYPNPRTYTDEGTNFNFYEFLKNPTYGISPYNTTLTVKYLKGGGLKSNVPSNTLNAIEYTTDITCNNPKASSGGREKDTIEDLRINSTHAFQTQSRAVTKKDYIGICKNMPPFLGSLSKIYVEPEKLVERRENHPSTLNLYVLGYDYNKKLNQASTSLKNNLKKYISQYRIINDYVKIKDAFVVNIGVNFDVVVRPSYNAGDVVLTCIEEIKEFFDIDKWNINQPIFLKEIYLLLDKVGGVQTVNNVEIYNKFGVGGEDDYNVYEYDLRQATIDNIIYPSIDPMIFEIKFPNLDIKGRSSSF